MNWVSESIEEAKMTRADWEAAEKERKMKEKETKGDKPARFKTSQTADKLAGSRAKEREELPTALSAYLAKGGKITKVTAKKAKK
jgi:hypothetical protein